MKKDNKQSKNNLATIVVGFFLIILVTGLFFLKSSFLNNKQSKKISSDQNQKEANDFKKYTSISSADLLKKINNKEDFKIFDIRDGNSFSVGHIADSQNISSDDLIKNADSFDKNKQYYIVDDLGFTPTEKELIDNLLGIGFQKVSYLEGGIYNWMNELNPTVEFGNPKSLSDQAKVNYITSESLKKLITEEGTTLILVDLRDNIAYSAGHLKNAINIPLDNLEARRKEIPGYKRIILYDDAGILAFQAAVRLFDMGVLNVFALSDGLNGWKGKGFEIVK